ncbi:MAG TPA: DUF6599 family protein [Bacteroidales bacterium]|nr:DUF6599 family protein [Bacteroidales bacterium]
MEIFIGLLRREACITAVLLAFSVFFIMPAAGQTSRSAFLPDAGEIPGWRPSGDAIIFRENNLAGIAADESSLILEYGINYAVSRQYYNFGRRTIKVNVFVMNNTFGSYGLFLRHSRKEKVFSKYGNSCYEKPGEFGFWKQFYFIRMQSDFKNDSVSEGFSQMASFIDSKIKARGLFPSILGQAGDNAKNIRLFSGPLGLAEIYYFSPLDIFFVQEGISYERGDTTRIILSYHDNNEAVKRYTDAAGILSAMPKFSGFRMDGNLGYQMKDREGRILLLRVKDSDLEITIHK